MIREATADDVPQIVAMGRRFLNETAYRGRIRENPEQMQALALRLIEGPDAVVFVSERDGHLDGMIGLAVYPQPMSGDRIAGELFWWANPESRRDGVRLLRVAERWATAMGAVALQMIAPTARVGKFYQAVGYEPVETAYQRTL